MVYLKPVELWSQSCVDDYFDIHFNTSTVQEPTSSAFTAANEIIMAGSVYRYHSLLKEGWLTKFSARGTVLWTRHYNTNAYNYTVFNNVTAVENEQFLISGNIGDVDTTSWPVTHLSQYAFLMKVDKYGNPIWAKIMGRIYVSVFEAFSDINDVEFTKQGDYLLSMNYSTDKNYNIIFRMDKDGAVKWGASIHSDASQALMGAPKIRQLNNGTVVFANSLSFLDDTRPYQQQGYYFASLDGETGAIKQEHFFQNTDTLSGGQKIFGPITGITELPDGKLSFITSFADNKYITFRETKKILNYITDGSGSLLKVLSYSNDEPPLYASSSAPAVTAGNSIVLLDNGDAPFMMELEPDGNIKWQKSYAALGRSQETRSVLSTQYGYYFFSFTHDGGSKLLNLVKTDVVGYNNCLASSQNFKIEDITSTYLNRYINLKFEQPWVPWNKFAALGFADYTMSGSYGCRKICCTDVTDTTGKISLCDKPYYILPNKDTVTKSGTYAVVYKTTKGCDSIKYYNIDFAYTPQISLGADRCMGQKDTIILKAQQGYGNYTWNGFNTWKDTFAVRQPGIYIVSVTNFCGTKKDTIMVYKECEFEILMPNAFTPNRDNVNDIFRIPPQVSNRLVNFTVFNRWGQVVFRTANIAEGWNGTFKDYPAPAGTYVYYIVMKSIDGRRNVTKKGYVTLLR